MSAGWWEDPRVSEFYRARADFFSRLSDSGLDHWGALGPWVLKALRWGASDAVISCRAGGAMGLFRILGDIRREWIGWSEEESRRALWSAMALSRERPVDEALDRFVSFELPIALGEFGEFSCQARFQAVPVSGPQGAQGLDIALRLIAPANLAAFDAARERRALGEELGVAAERASTEGSRL